MSTLIRSTHVGTLVGALVGTWGCMGAVATQMLLVDMLGRVVFGTFV